MEAVKEKRLWECWISWLDSWGGAEMYIKSIPYITVLLKKYTDIC